MINAGEESNQVQDFAQCQLRSQKILSILLSFFQVAMQSIELWEVGSYIFFFQVTEAHKRCKILWFLLSDTIDWEGQPEKYIRIIFLRLWWLYSGNNYPWFLWWQIQLAFLMGRIWEIMQGYVFNKRWKAEEELSGLFLISFLDYFHSASVSCCGTVGWSSFLHLSFAFLRQKNKDSSIAKKHHICPLSGLDRQNENWLVSKSNPSFQWHQQSKAVVLFGIVLEHLFHWPWERTKLHFTKHAFKFEIWNICDASTNERSFVGGHWKIYQDPVWISPKLVLLFNLY